MKLLKSIALISGAMAVMVVVGLLAFLVIWVAVFGLYIYSRLSKRAVLFADWSWFQILMTIGFGLGIPYVILLVTAGF
jgi:hypothetical protein